MKKKRYLSLMLTVCMLLILATACGSTTNTSDSAASTAVDSNADGPTEDGSEDEDRTVTVATTKSHLYFYSAGSGENDNLCRRLIYDQLFYIDDATGETCSDILNDWEWMDDVTLRLSLKDGVLFSDGTQMTGEDILYTLQSYVDNGNSELEFYKRIDFDTSYVEEDGLTTYVIYESVYGPALSTLCVPVLSKDFCESHPDGDDAWWYTPVGSGPYTVGTVVMGTSVEYILRDDYWNESASFDAERIVVKYYSDATAEYADFLSGDVDVMLDITAAQIETLRDTEDAEIVIQSANDVLLFCFNENTIPAYIREAVAYAVDWDAVAQVGYGELCIPATCHFASTFDAYTDRSGTDLIYTYDPDRAKAILEENGYDGTLSVDLVLASGTFTEQVAEAMQYYLGQVGIGLFVNAMDVSAMLPALIGGDGDAGWQEAANNGNPTKDVNKAISTLASDGFAIMAISDEEFNGLLQAGLETVDLETQAEIYKQVDQWLYENYQAIPVCEKLEAFAYNSAKIASLDMASVVRGNLAGVRLAG